MALNSSLPAFLRDGLLSTYQKSSSSLTITLPYKILITEVFVQIGNISSSSRPKDDIYNIKLLHGQVELTMCQSPQKVTHNQSVVFYCQNYAVFERSLTLLICSQLFNGKCSSGIYLPSVMLSEVLVFGKTYPYPPAVVFPLASTAPDVADLGTNSQEFTLRFKKNSHAQGVTEEENGAALFGREEGSSISYRISNGSSLLTTKSLAICGWFYFSELPVNYEILFRFRPENVVLKTTGVIIKNDKVDVLLGYKEQKKIDKVVKSVGFHFKKGVWYHITMSYDDISEYGSIFIHGVNLGSTSTKVYLSLSNIFTIGYLFPGKIACVQMFSNAIKVEEIPHIMYQCYDGQPVPLRPLILFPFGVNNTYQNVMDLSMEVTLTGNEIFGYNGRFGVLNEPLNAITFKIPSRDCIDCPLSRLKIDPSYNLKMKYAITVMMWFKQSGSQPLHEICYLYKQGSLLIKSHKRIISVEYTYEQESTKSTALLETDSLPTLTKWFFVVFSFSTYTGEASLEVRGNLPGSPILKINKHTPGKLVLDGIKKESEIGQNCSTKMACLQVYNTRLSQQQKAMAKYTCLAGKEGLYKKPLPLQLTTNKVYAPETTLKWNPSEYLNIARLLGIPVQGYRGLVRNHRTGHLDIYNMSCAQFQFTAKNLVVGALYSARVQPFGYDNGPLSTEIYFKVFRVPILPPSNIQANVTGESSVIVTWNKTKSQVSGYMVTATSLNSTITSVTIATCANQSEITFTNLAAFTKYNITVLGFDSKQLGDTTTVVVTTQQEPPRIAPSYFVVYNVRINNPRKLTFNWYHRPHPELKGIIKGFKISAWLTNNSSVSSVFYSERSYFSTTNLDIEKNYTFVVQAFTENPIMGPASQPTTNHEEIGAILPPKNLEAVQSHVFCNEVNLSWDKPPIYPPSGVVRAYHITYYNYTGGSKAAKILVVKKRLATLTGLAQNELYGICVAARTLPSTRFGPCTDFVNVSTSCRLTGTPVSNLTSTTSPTTTAASNGLPGSWGEWSQCNETCGHGIKTRYRRCLSGSCSTSSLSQDQPCYKTDCLDLSIDANLTSQTWIDSLANNTSKEFKHLQSVLCSNIERFYGSLSCFVEKFWKGSVMTTFHANFSSLSAETLLKLQESSEINKTIGSLPAVLNNVHSKTVPEIGPNITFVKVMTATSVQVSWESINSMYRDIQGYLTSYRPENIYTWSTATCGSSCTSIIVENVQPNVTYRFRVQTFTVKGYGVAGTPVYLNIPPLVSKNIFPPNVMAAAQSSTSIVIQWEALPDGVISGIFLGYRIVCQETDTGKIIEKTAASWVRFVIFDSLNKYTWYSVRVFGYSDQGMGIPNPLTSVQTLEDIPSAPPSNVVIQDMFHTKLIKLKWSPVPREHRNGIILGYRIKYKIASESKYDETKRVELDLAPNATEYELSNLASSASYEVELLAYTSVGNGVSAKLTGGTCRCNADVYTNFISYPPYVIVQPSDNLDGIFGSIVEDMILTVCGVCPNGHGKSKLHFKNNGKGYHSNKQTQKEVLNDIDDITDVSFPVYGYVSDTSYMDYYAYVPVVQSPGIAFLAIRQEVNTATNNAMYNMITNSWMLLVLVLALMYLFGIVVWATDKNSNTDQFPLAFHRGAWEGLWFTFVSMTTVGYGDRAPKSVVTRLVSIVWTLMGLVVLSIFMGIVTSSLTVITTEINQESKIYGASVSAVENSTEYKTGILKNAKMVGYPTLKETYNSLSSGDIQGILVDAYVAGSAEQIRLQPENTYVNRIIDKSISYGVVLSGRVTRLGPDCREYIKQNQAKIAKLVTDFVKPINDNLVVNQTDELPVKPYQSKSKVNIMDVIKYLLVVLGTLVAAGTIWECFYMCSSKHKRVNVRTTYSDDILEMKDSVKMFYRRTNKILSQLREKHQQELKYFRKNYGKNGKNLEKNVSII